TSTAVRGSPFLESFNFPLCGSEVDIGFERDGGTFGFKYAMLTTSVKVWHATL
ncbi:hypothetical protein HAX54_016555, partial [Datura stramonium]|nr:hypothetical protein [Datura stramonium]